MLQILSLVITWMMELVLQYLAYGVNTASIASMLLVVIIVSLYVALSDNQISCIRYLAPVFLILCIFIPTLRPYIGTVILLYRRVDNPLHIMLYAAAAGISFLLFAVSSPLIYSVCLLFLIAICALLNLLLHDLHESHMHMIQLRDSAKEQQLIVEEKNKALRDSQDSQIHLATLQERNRIAREIHDNVGHMLTRSILQTGAIKTINKDENLAPLLNGLHDTLNTAMTNIRQSVHDLHDESVDLTFSLKDILQSADSFHTELLIDPAITVPRNIKYGFIAIVKEAVNNSIKHSNGNMIRVSVHEHPGFYQLIIEDNGHNAGINTENGIGLTNIQDRVKEMGGTVSISCENGFKIFVSIFKP